MSDSAFSKLNLAEPLARAVAVHLGDQAQHHAAPLEPVPEVVAGFVKHAAANGMDIFRIFDSLKYLPNLTAAMQAVRTTHLDDFIWRRAASLPEYTALVSDAGLADARRRAMCARRVTEYHVACACAGNA